MEAARRSKPKGAQLHDLDFDIPKTLSIKAAPESEAMLKDRARKWVESAERTPGIHASDLLSPLMAYWNRKHPTPISDRLVGIFLVGKVLHAFVLSAVEGATGTDWSTDEGSKTSTELGIEYSMDAFIDGVPRELKTSRSLFLPKQIKDLWTYAKQTLVYMAAEDALAGEIWCLYLNCKINNQTSPAFKAYRLTISREDLDALKIKLRGIRDAIQHALDTDDPSKLPLCERFKCGRGNCPHFDVCKPEGRWEEDPLIMPDAKPEPKAEAKKAAPKRRKKAA